MFSIYIYTSIIIPSKIKNVRNGRRTSSQENQVAPALQNRFKTQVQNKMYIIFIKKIIETLVTSHSNAPKQYTFVLPAFCIAIIISAIIEITKYKYAGVHKLRKPTAIISYIPKLKIGYSHYIHNLVQLVDYLE